MISFFRRIRGLFTLWILGLVLGIVGAVLHSPLGQGVSLTGAVLFTIAAMNLLYKGIDVVVERARKEQGN